MIFLVLALLFVLMEGLLSGIEVGMISLMPARVQHGVRVGHPRAWILDFFTRRPDYLLATALVAQNIFLVAASNMALRGVGEMGLDGPLAGILVTGVIPVLLLLSEIIHKDWFRQYPYERCRLFAHLFNASFWLLWPPVTLAAKLTGLVNRLFGGHRADADTARVLMREDFRILLRESEKDELIDPAAADLLERSLDFHGLLVGDIFRHRGEVLQISAAATLDQALALCRSRNLSRAPVYAGDAPSQGDQPWCGIFNAYDVLFTVPEPEWITTRVADLLRPVTTVAANQRMEDVIVEVKRSRSTLIVVASPEAPDQHLGIVTPSDVAAVLFG
jgi:CBS domain containing-hemolysin-like protein